MALYLPTALLAFAAACIAAVFAITREHISETMRRAGSMRAAALTVIFSREHEALPRLNESVNERQGRYIVSAGSGLLGALLGVNIHLPPIWTVAIGAAAASSISWLLLLSWRVRQQRLTSRLNVQATWLVSQLPAIIAAVGDNERSLLRVAAEDAEPELADAIQEVLADVKLGVRLYDALGPWRRSSVHVLNELAAALPAIIEMPRVAQEAAVRELESRVLHDLETQVHREVDRNASWIHLLAGTSVVGYIVALVIVPTAQSISAALSLR